jgi:murein L,D-transpeptidase YcbB/YkuD
MRKRAVNATLWISATVILTLAGVAGCRRGGQPVPELQALLSADTLDRQVGDARIRAAVREVYTETGATLLWRRGLSRKPADAALKVLASARDHGLDPDQYQYSALTQERDGLDRAPRAERKQRQAMFDVRLTAALLRLGRDVAVGRLDPRSFDRRWKAQRRPPDLVKTLVGARDDIGRWLPAIQPPQAEYAGLMRGLASLHGAAAKGGWPSLPAVALRPGASHSAVATLRRRLAASGNLGAAAIEGTRFDRPLEAALRSFQEHHALPATGRLDPKTRAALNVPLDARIAQVALNLERWRWMPDDLGARHFRVNVPYYHLEAYEHGKVVLDIRAVVGKRGNETPIFSERMTHVVLSPYWNIPPGIATGETLPAVAQDPGYLERQNIEVVRVSDGAASVVDPSTLDWDDEESLQGLRFRQRPGAANALGFVKFMFPNPYDVYVHDTPSDALFTRLGRAFSHGCIRVEEPKALAAYVLRDQPRWTGEALDAAMHSGTETHVRLREPIPVHITYFTSWVDADGGLHFLGDVYGHDARQGARLNARGPGKRPDSSKARPRPRERGQEARADDLVAVVAPLAGR